MRLYTLNGTEINGLTLDIEGAELSCSENGYCITYAGKKVVQPKYFLANLEDQMKASFNTMELADSNAALSHSAWFTTQITSKEEFRAKKLILAKASAVREVLVEAINTFIKGTGENHITKSYKLLAQTIAGKDKETGEQRTVHKINEYIQYAAGFISLDDDLQTSVIASILKAMYQHQVNPVAKGGILADSLESQVSKPIGEVVGKYILTNFKLKAETKRTSMSVDMVDIYAEKGIEFTHVLLELLKYFGILWIFVPDGKVSYEVFPRVQFLKLDDKKDKHIIKHLSKDYTSTNLKEQRILACEQRVQEYSGTPAKKNPIEQPQRVTEIMDSMRSCELEFSTRLTDPSHPLGKEMLTLMYNSFEHQSQKEEFTRYLAESKGKTLFQSARLTKDNGRVNTTQNTTAGKAKLYESKTKYLISDKGAELYRAAIKKLQGKADPSRKEKMELLHYQDAIWCYENKIPSGHYYSKDFTGSGPLMQALATGDWERVLFSISYNGSHAHDPYKEILARVFNVIPKATMRAKVVNLYGELTINEIDGILRQWVKSLMQPTMYGAGRETAVKKGNEDSKHFDLDYDVFMKAFEEALPGTFRLLKHLREFSTELVKYIGKNPRDPRFRTLQYSNPFGTQCRITSFKKCVDEDGNSVPYKYTFSLGRRKSIGVPVAIIDPEALGSSVLAAFSHQFDSSIMMMIHKLVREMKLAEGFINSKDSLCSTHDDFLDHVNFNDMIDIAAQQALQFHWDVEDAVGLFCNQISQPLGFTFKPFKYIQDKRMLDIDWSKVKPFG